MITARLGTEKDIDRIVEIRNIISGYIDFTPEYVQDRLKRKDCIVSVGCDDNRVIGFGFIETRKSPYIVTHFMLDPTWSNLVPLNKLTALKAMSLVWLKYCFQMGKDNKTRYTFFENTHTLVQTAIHAKSWMNFQKVGTNQNGEAIYETTFTDQKLLDNNLSLLKE